MSRAEDWQHWLAVDHIAAAQKHARAAQLQIAMLPRQGPDLQHQLEIEQHFRLAQLHATLATRLP